MAETQNTGPMQPDLMLSSTLQAKWGVPAGTSGMIWGPDALGAFGGFLYYASNGVPAATFKNLPPNVVIIDTTAWVLYLKIGAIGTNTYKASAAMT